MRDLSNRPAGLDDDLADLVAFRHDLHRNPELSGEEGHTAQRVRAMLAPTDPDAVIADLGGHGIAAVYGGAEPGPTVMLRCELDGLPIHETGAPAHRSTVEGKGHLCGHDGHMAMLTGVARMLARRRPTRGRVVLLYQPAEETGAGAAAVLADPRFAAVAPDYSFAIHNYPGLPMGTVMVGEGPVNCASRGLQITLEGRTAHASQPETGCSPMPALARLMPELAAMSRPMGEGFRLVTVTHASMGEPAFGIAPGRAELWVTLRTLVDAQMDALCDEAQAAVRRAAGAEGLNAAFAFHDVFLHCENHPEAVATIRAALDDLGIAHSDRGLPMRASEDFGRFGHRSRAAMLFLGAGTEVAALHNPDYDFPDALIGPGVAIFERILRRLLD